ncbi:MAG: twin-arginine translocase subunit TatC, partial [Pseudomonadota bacterium]
EQGGDGQASIQLVARVSEYLSLIMTLIFAFGFCFQMPVLFTLLARAGMISANTLATKRKYAVVIVFLVAAFLTPPDPISQLGLAIPTLLLYEISIIAVRMIERARDRREAERDAELES